MTKTKNKEVKSDETSSAPKDKEVKSDQFSAIFVKSFRILR